MRYWYQIIRVFLAVVLFGIIAGNAHATPPTFPVAIPIHNGGTFATGLEQYDVLEGVGDGIRLEADSYTKLMVHANGADESTTFTDDSASSHTVNTIPNAQVDTAQKKFGTGSLLLDGNTDEITVTDSYTDFQFGAGSWTIDGQFYLDEAMGTTRILTGLGGGGETWNTTDGHEYILNLDTASKLTFQYNNSGVVASVLSSVVDITSSFHHIALVNNAIGDTFNIYLGGISVYSGTAITITPVTNLSKFSIGGIVGDQPAIHYIGWIDEFRVSKGVARWTENFSGSLPDTEYFAYYPTSPATTGPWTAFPVGEFTMSTTRLVVFKDGVVQDVDSEDVKCQYKANDAGSFSNFLTLEDFRLESDITITDTTNSINVQCQGNTDGSYQTAMKYKMEIDFTPTASGAGYSRGRIVNQ